MQTPNYDDNSIVNLMSSILAHFEIESPYKPLKILNPNEFDENETIILMVIDGLGYNFLQKNGNNRENPSFLFKNLKGKITSVFPTTTAAAMTSFYSGLAPQNHAVPAWFSYLKEIGMVSTILPFKTRGFDFSFEKNNIFPSDIFSFKSLFSNIKYDYYSIIPKNLKGSAYSNFVLEGSKQIGFKNLNDFFKKISKAALAKSTKSKKYIIAYWPEFDAISHKKGVQSRVAFDHFREIDKRISIFTSKMKEKSLKFRLIITADHGLIDTIPEHTIWLKNHPKLKETLILPICGEPRAPFFYVRPSKIEDFENYVNSKLNHAGDLKKGEKLILDHLFGLNECNSQIFERVGDYVLLMKENYIFRDQLIGENRHELIGNHGGLSDDELFVPLIVI